MASPFEVLGVDRDADAAEIQQAYWDRVKEAHPDQGGSAEAFQLVQEAYEAIEAGDYDHAGDAAEPEAEAAPEPAQPGSEVEYLNYEVLDDYGWSVEDADLFANATDAELDAVDYGRMRVRPDESLLEAAERDGFEWPFACRGGACANCAVFVVEGELSTPINHVLPQELVDRGIQLSCNGVPLTPEMKVVFNVKHMPELEELLLPPRPFRQAYGDD